MEDPNPNDRIRQVILEYFYNLHLNAKGVSSISHSISEVKSDLKSKGLRPPEIIHNLMYLVKTGWIDEDTQAYTIPMKGLTAKKVTYRISNLGVDYFEGPSRFGKTKSHAGIDISNVSGVVIIGDKNIVQSKFENLYRHLDLLEQSIGISDKLSGEQKVDYRAEIETIKSQLAKSTPDRGILSKSWTVISTLSTIPALFEIVESVRKILGPLVGLG